MNEEKLTRWIIYAYTFPNGKRYVGKSKRSLPRRQGSDFNRYRNCPALWNAIQKYGIDSIEQEIIIDDYMTDEDASNVEQEFIELYRTNCNRYNNPKMGYNLTDGGEGLNGWHPDEERLRVLREQMYLFHEQRRGTHHSEEAKRKMREAKLGIKRGPMSDETKRKIAIANCRENMSEETARRRSAAVKKKVLATNNDTGEEIIFNSVEEAASYFGVRDSSIARWANGTRTPRNNNYSFKIYPRTTTKREGVI